MRKLDDEHEMDIMPSPRSESLTLSVLRSALADLNRHHISYCYWKSGRNIHSALAGERDLDLLVARQDQHRVAMLLLALGFKLFPAVASRDHPSVMSFLGHDEPSGRLVHIHLHVRLVVGEPLLKNYRLPWEEIILARAVLHPTLSVRMLDPMIEAVLLAVRSSLELRRLDPVMLRNWREATRKFALDRADVAARTDRGALREMAATLVNGELADMIVDAIYGDRALEHQHRFRRAIGRHLAIHRTYNGCEARLRGAWRAILWVFGNMNKHLLHVPRPWSRRAPGGGCVVAVVGVDGSGKTTTMAAIRKWLGSEIDVVPVYFGTGAGRPSLLLRPFKLLVPLMSRILKEKPKGASHGNVSGRAPGPLYSILMMGWATIVAREKRNKLLSARRGADRGLVVITDRYPQDEIIGFNDGPLLTRLTTVPNWLRRVEADSYRLVRRLVPDLVIKLDVLTETAARREPDMDPALISERIADLQRLTFAGASVVRVDAEQPLVEVIRAVKREIWRML